MKKNNDEKIYTFTVNLRTVNTHASKTIAYDFIIGDDSINDNCVWSIRFKADNDDKAIDKHKYLSNKIESFMKNLVYDLNNRHKNFSVSTNV